MSYSSKSKQQQFIPHIQKDITPRTIDSKGSYNSYGLAKNSKHLGTVPDLSKYLFIAKKNYQLKINELNKHLTLGS